MTSWGWWEKKRDKGKWGMLPSSVYSRKKNTFVFLFCRKSVPVTSVLVLGLCLSGLNIPGLFFPFETHFTGCRRAESSPYASVASPTRLHRDRLCKQRDQGDCVITFRLVLNSCSIIAYFLQSLSDWLTDNDWVMQSQLNCNGNYCALTSLSLKCR